MSSLNNSIEDFIKSDHAEQACIEALDYICDIIDSKKKGLGVLSTESSVSEPKANIILETGVIGLSFKKEGKILLGYKSDDKKLILGYEKSIDSLSYDSFLEEFVEGLRFLGVSF